MARGAPVRNPVAKNRPAPDARVVVSVKRLFSQESPHYVVMVAIVFFLVIFGLVMVLSSSFVDSALGNDGNFFCLSAAGHVGVNGDSGHVVTLQSPTDCVPASSPRGVARSLVLTESCLHAPRGYFGGKPKLDRRGEFFRAAF